MNKQEVLKALVSLKEEIPNTCFGICWNTCHLLGYRIDNWIDQKVVKWSKFSGNKIWPVPHPKKGCPIVAFMRSENAWDGDYGQLRYELLDFLIEELTKEIKEENRNA